MLGDVVCGGFAAPLRRGFGQIVCIVTSPETISLFAANNIARLVANCHAEGANLAGLIVNSRAGSREVDRDQLRRFAERIGTRVLAFLPHDRALAAASDRFQTVIEAAPDAPSAAAFSEIADRLLEAAERHAARPTPLDDDAFFTFVRTERQAVGAAPDASPDAAATDAPGPAPAEPPEPDEGPLPEPREPEEPESQWTGWFVGGAKARARMARLLAVPPAPVDGAPVTRTVLADVIWCDEDVVVGEIVGRNDSRIRVVFRPPGDEQVFFEGPRITMAYTLDESLVIDRSRVIAWLERVAGRVRARAAADVVAWLEKAGGKSVFAAPDGFPEGDGSRRPADEPDPSDDEPEDDEQRQRAAGEPSADGEPEPASAGPAKAEAEWRRHVRLDAMGALFDMEIGVDFGLMENSGVRFGELECLVPSLAPFQVHPLLATPVLAAARRADARGGSTRARIAARTRFADLTESDRVHGHRHKLERIAEAAVASSPTETVTFDQCCTSIVVGDDVNPVARTMSCGGRCSVELRRPTAESHWIRRRIEKALGAPAETGTRSEAYNLVGFPAGRAVEELTGLLAEGGGLERHQMVLPGAFSGDPERFFDAARTVFLPHRFYEPCAAPLRALAGESAIDVPAPFGVSATRDWLRAVGEAFGRREAVDAAWEAAFAELDVSWRRLRERAAAHRVALVLTAAEAAALDRPADWGGVDVVGFLVEAGFSLEIAVPPGGPEDAPALVSLSAAHERLSVVAPGSPDELIRRCREAQWGALLSNVEHPPLLRELGIGRFSLFDFRMGLRGALETADLILRACQVDFWRRYGRYLEVS